MSEFESTADPGPETPWADRLMMLLGLLAAVALTLAAYKGDR